MLIAYTHSGGWNLNIPIIAWLLVSFPALLDSALEEWFDLERRILKMYPKGRTEHKVCPFAPRSLLEYIWHKTWILWAEIEATEEAVRKRHLRSKKPVKPFNIKDCAFWSRRYGGLRAFEDCMSWITGDWNRHSDHPFRSPVLGELTIWHFHIKFPHEYVPYRPLVNWPSAYEMSWEGDQRVATENGRYGRFLPLPRRDDYSYEIKWEDKDAIEPWPFDQVWHVPTGEDIYLEEEGVDPSDIPSLLNQDLLDAIDQDTIPISSGKVEELVREHDRKVRLGLLP